MLLCALNRYVAPAVLKPDFGLASAQERNIVVEQIPTRSAGWCRQPKGVLKAGLAIAIKGICWYFEKRSCRSSSRPQ